MLDRAITGGEVVLPGQGRFALDIGIEGGRVACLAPPGTLSAREEIDAAGRLVIPGAVDAHVHVFDDTYVEEMRTESRSAARGGVTSMLIYLMQAGRYEHRFEQMVAAGEQQSIVDFGFHYCIVNPDQLSGMEAYVETHGVTSFKYFLTSRGEEAHRLGFTEVDDGFLWRFLSECRRLGVLPCVHCENIEVFYHRREELRAAGRRDLEAWNLARPPVLEAEGAAKVLAFAEAIGLPTVYLVHMTSAAVLDGVRRSSFTPVLETCLHYLTKTCDSPIGLMGKVNPPLRRQSDVEALWQAVAGGEIEVLATDHVPRTLGDKQGDIWTAGPGFPGVGSLVPVAMTEAVDRRGMAVEDVVAMLTANPAKRFGLYPRKGTLLPGSDADVAILDPSAEARVAADRDPSRSGFSVYEGDTVRYWPCLTMLRGEVVARDGELSGGGGRYLRRSLRERDRPPAMA